MKRARPRHASPTHRSGPLRGTAKRAAVTPARPSRRRPRVGPAAGDLVIVSRALTDLADFLRERQESAGRGRVIVDRRVGERRRLPRRVDDDRRHSDRRRAASDPTEALMRVLGFMVVPPGAPRPARSRPRRSRS
jgi:hypothetical protein